MNNLNKKVEWSGTEQVMIKMALSSLEISNKFISNKWKNEEIGF